MDPKISEFSYGFALTHEIVSFGSGRIIGAPEFPSLLREGRPGGGYDVRINFIGAPFIFQFKLSEYMVSPKAGEWKKFYDRYYRFWITPRDISDQHKWLLELEDLYKNVYYAAPAFYEVKSLNQAFLDRNVIENSVFVKPSNIRALPDNDWHCVAFQPGQAYGYFCSDPRKIEIDTGKHFTKSIENKENPLEYGHITNEYLYEMYDQLNKMLLEGFGEHELGKLGWLNNLPIIDRIFFIFKTFLGAELIFIRESL